MSGRPLLHHPAREQFYRDRGLWTDERIGWLLDNAAARWGDREFLVINDRRLGFAALNRMVEAVAAFLIGHGVAPGDRVVMQSGNCLELIVLLFATWRIGACAVPVVPIYREHELRAIIAEMRPAVIAAGGRSDDEGPFSTIPRIVDAIGHTPRLTIALGSNEAMAGWRPLVLDGPPADLPTRPRRRIAAPSCSPRAPPRRPKAS